MGIEATAFAQFHFALLCFALTDPQTNTQTNTQTHIHTNKQTRPITIRCAAKLSAQCNEKALQGDANTARWL